MKEKIIKLIKSSILEDTLIGLNLLLENYSKSEIITIFQEEGDYSGFSDAPYLSSRSFRRNYDKNSAWVYYVRDGIGFFIRDRVLIVNDLQYQSDYYVKNPL